MIEILNKFLSQLNPTTGIIIVGLIIIVITLWRLILNYQDEIDRLRKERNDAVDKKDIQLTAINNKVYELHEKTMETLNKFGNEAEIRAVRDEAKTDAILEALKGFQSFLINIKK